ncbi:ComF family protein [Cohnella panacarvi]|uniref:ComF family protein n=1 Tax=Cohnella panacarvi TaxID=400776 RepID=UPI00047D83A1|nr:ComF family protein [Cohnella panacarvi]
MSALDRISQWFAVSRHACPICGQRRSSHSPLLLPVRHPRPRRILQALCGVCRSDIPWITHPLCRVCGRAERCGDCARRKIRYFEACRCAVRYDDRMRDWLARYKYRGNERLAPILAAMLAYVYESRFASMSIGAITSVPLSPERLGERGFNQAESLAVQLAEWYSIPYVPLLRRTRHTEKQSLKSRRSRVIDMKGIFECMDDAASVTPRPVNLLLIDDVYTTGSTIDECARIIRGAHPYSRIYGLAWAR